MFKSFQNLVLRTLVYICVLIFRSENRYLWFIQSQCDNRLALYAYLMFHM